MNAGRSAGVKPGFVAGGLSKSTGRASASPRGGPAVRRDVRPPAGGWAEQRGRVVALLGAAHASEARVDQNTCALQRFAE
ncbi:hypothetical protein WS69_05080 [Burkholderia sp. BDU5]|nr:hypothetical protein WS69_05080 [Burkholderia sp. BDU5]